MPPVMVMVRVLCWPDGGVGVSDGVNAGGGGSGCGSVAGAGVVVGQCWLASSVRLMLARVS